MITDFLHEHGGPFRTVQHYHQRLTRGWSYRDCWSIDRYLLRVIPDMVEHLRFYGSGYQPYALLSDDERNALPPEVLHSADNHDQHIRDWHTMLDTIIYGLRKEAFLLENLKEVDNDPDVTRAWTLFIQWRHAL